ncbi:MAG: lysostaphin resistance A-like protein [Anaerobacillus sp.]|uniref:CPBP family intramembrane glutamic endopeptidase n=1 Tax=Anaerobacillus sp. TaxID=1872506 RepID=UPI003918E3CA
MSNVLSFKKVSVWSVLIKIVLFMMLTLVVFLLAAFLLDIDITMIISLYSIVSYTGIIFILFHEFKTDGIEREFVIGNLSIRNESLLKYISIQVFITFFSILAVLTLLNLFTNMEDFIQEIIISAADAPQISGLILLLYVVAAVVFAPIAEELLFRGFLFNRWGETIGLGKAMIFSSIIFSAIHFNQGFIGHFIFGIFACIIYVKTKKLIIPIILHGLNNLIAISPQFLEVIFNTTTEATIDPVELKQFFDYFQIVLNIGTIIFFILTPVMIYIIYRLYPKGVKVTPYESNKLKSA